MPKAQERGEFRVCDNKKKAVIEDALRRLGVDEKRIPRGVCMACLDYKPAKHAYQDCDPHQKGACNPGTHAWFKPKKIGFELCVRVYDIARKLLAEQASELPS